MPEANVPVKLDDSNLQQIVIAVVVIFVTLGEVRVRLCQHAEHIFLEL